MSEKRGGPHDAFFRGIMAQPDNAAGEIRAKIIEEIGEQFSARIHWQELELMPNNFIHSDLRDRYGDLLYRTRLDDRPAFVYILLEHQSSTDRFMAFRILDYMVGIWRQYLADDHHKQDGAGRGLLPAIIPLVVHNSPRGRRWSAPTELAELLDVDPDTRTALGPYLPRLRFLLDDVTKIDLDALRRRELTSAARVLLVLQKIATGNTGLDRAMLDWLDDLRALGEGPDPVGVYRMVFTYLLKVGEATEADLAAVAEQINPRAKEAFVTTAEAIEARGEARGGAEVLIGLMTAKFGPLPEAVLRRIRSADADRHHVWATRVLTANSIEEALS